MIAEERRLGAAFRLLGESAARREERCAQVEAETDRWAALPRIADWEMPDVRFDRMRSARRIDRSLRKLGALWRGWDARVGHLALLLKKSCIHTSSGFSDFRQYCTERAGASGRTVEQSSPGTSSTCGRRR